MDRDITYLFALGSTVTFSAASVVFSRLATNLSSLWMNYFKAAVALVCFGAAIAISAAAGTWSGLPVTAALLAFLLSGIIGLGTGDIFLIKGFTTIGPARSLMIFSFQPVLMAAAAYVTFGQRLSTNQVAAILCMIACVFVLSYEGYRRHGHWEIKGLVYAILGVGFDAIGVLLTRYGFDRSPSTSPLEGNFYRTFGAVGALAMITLYVGTYAPKYARAPNTLLGGWRKLPARDRTLALVASALGTFVALWLWLTAVSRGHLATLTAISGTGPVFTTLFESVYHRRLPNRFAILALGLSMTGFYFVFGT